MQHLAAIAPDGSRWFDMTGAMKHGWTGKDPALDVTLLSLQPKVMRFRGMLTAKDGRPIGNQRN